MAFDSFKKKIAVANKAFGEKLSKHKSVNVTDEYRHLSSFIDIFKNYFEDVRKRAVECLEPGTNVRFRPSTALTNGPNHPTKEVYPHAEGNLASCLEKYGKAFEVDTPLGAALMVVGEAYHEVAEAKTRAIEDTQVRFVCPIKQTLSQEMKEIIALRKKADNKRMLFELEQNRVHKNKIPESHPDYVDAEQKFKQAYQDSESAMRNFLDSEASHIELLYNFVCSQLSFFEDAQSVLSNVRNRIQDKLDESRNTTGIRRMLSPKVPSMSTGDPEIDALTDIKPKYQNQPAAVPTCRALYDFDAENPFEMSFKEGSVIRLIEQVDEHWFLGEYNGQEGHFPTNFVEVLTPLP